MSAAVGARGVSRRALMLGEAGVGTPVLVAGLLLWLAFEDGGYFPVTWNLVALVLLWVAAAVLLLRREIALGRFDAALLVALAGLVVWTGLSSLWSIAPANSILESQRTLLYFASGAAALLIASRRAARPTVFAVLGASTVVCGYALLDRLGAVDTLPYNRLGGSLGYWNALGILAAAGVLLSLAAAAHERRPVARAVAGFPLPILVAALYLTFSRGSWLALGAGLALSAWLDPRRTELAGALAALAPPCVVILAFGASAHALIAPGGPSAAVTADAHQLGALVLVMCAVSAWLATFAPRVRRWLPRLPVRRLVAVAVVCTIVAGVIVAGGPQRLPGVATRALAAGPPNTPTDLNGRLFNLSSSWRGEMWNVALKTFANRPVVGYGAGTYGRLWLMDRQDAITIQDAHSLYLETLAELGAVGLALLVVVLAVPLLVARRLLQHPYIPALTALYVALLAHAAIDWDWEMPIITVTAVLCAAAILAAARGELRPVRRNIRIGGLAVALGLGGCTLFLLVGNRDLNAAAAAAASGQKTLQARARAAERWAPWSPDPPRWLATVQLDRGNRIAARRLLADAIAKDGTDWSLWLEMAAASNGPARTRAILNAIRLDPKGPELRQTALQYGLISPARHKA